MAFKKKVDKGQGTQFIFEEEGQSLTGYYLGSFPFTGDYGPTHIHMFNNEDGTHSIFGQKQLTGLLEDLQDQIGANMRITYVGEKPSKKKGFNPMKLYELEYDEDDRMDAADLAAASEAAQSQDDTDGSDPTDEEVEEPAPRAAAPKTATRTPPPSAKPAARPQPSAEAKARTAALLAGRK